ncbi:leukocyte antigen CD37 isoform X1 [Callorhinus ursinus]|uniref:Leukocyte antigen CD37 n=2 Tax=Callorhinus ursinus TaxID=34884 RepID=A0A3Q7MEW4_CALUR|nr:leukocyte antigen CD37 isoform X1 [Callorhinus ursinus]XP_025705408.1 leukocyte antigen CD37 isoform X1 [Callorhinus ursinus]
MSAQDSCLSLIKYLLFVFNLFFFVLGSLIFCFGIWILIDKTSFVSFVGLSFVPLQIWSKALAISGILTMGLALLGCVGALKELRCLLGLYFGILLLLFATQITLGILISTQRMRLERRVKDIVMETIQNYRSRPEESAAEESWDYVQFQLRCCGWNSPRDWFSIPSLISNESEVHRVPCSCYNSSATNDSAVFDKLSFPQFSRLRPLARPRHSTDLCVVPANSNIYNEGCARSLQKWLHDNLISIVGICLGVGLLEVSVAGLSLLLLRCALRRERQLQVPGACGSSPGPGPSADGGGGRCGVLSSSARSGGLWGGWGMADACPNWGDKSPQGKLPMALGPWPLWDQDEEQPETRSAGEEVEVEVELAAEAERETDEPPE